MCSLKQPSATRWMMIGTHCIDLLDNGIGRLQPVVKLLACHCRCRVAHLAVVWPLTEA